MDRLAHSTVKPKHLEQNLNSSDGDTGSNKPTSTSQNKTTPPTLRNVVEINGRIIYPSIQLNEHKNSIIGHDDDSSIVESSGSDDEGSSSIVESSSSSDEDDNGKFKKPTSEITIRSRPSSTQKKNSVTAFEVQSTSFFEHMPKEVIRKILLEHVVDLNHIHVTAKNLMNFANISKFNREFVWQLLTEEGMHEVSFEITKSVIPNLLSTLANDINAEFSQEDIDRLVGNYPYLTFDSSYEKNKKNFTIKGNEALKQIVSLSGLKGLRVVNILPVKILDWNEDYQAFNNKGLELIHSLFSRGSSDQIKIDLMLNNWVPPFNSIGNLNDKSFELLKEIKDGADRCDSITLGEINLSRIVIDRKGFYFIKNYLSSITSRDYQFKFVKIMCNIALTHSAHTISLAGLQLSDQELGLIINEIQVCDKSSLQHLDLSGNNLYKGALKILSKWLQSDNTCIKTLNLDNTNLTEDKIDLLWEALKNNHSLEAVYIKDRSIGADHPIRNDERVRLIENF